MDMRLSVEDGALQRRARAFTDEVLEPLEDECEANDGLRPRATRPPSGPCSRPASTASTTRSTTAARLRHVPADADRRTVGRATGAGHPVASFDPARLEAPRSRRNGSAPGDPGRRRDAYAITEEEGGLTSPAVATTARRDGDAWVLDGEKWHVTSGDVADFFLVHAHVDGDPAKATVFLVDKDTPGVRVVRTPKYTHTFVFEHPIYAFEGVRVGDDRVLGEVGEGFEPEGLVRRGTHHDRRPHDGRERPCARALARVRPGPAPSAGRSSGSRRSSSCSPTWRRRSWRRSRSPRAGKPRAAMPIASRPTRWRAP